MPALPVYTPVSVWRNSITSSGRGPLGVVMVGVLVQILQVAPPETEDNKGQTPLINFTILTYKPAWGSQLNPDIQVGDRLRDNLGVEYTVQGVKDVFGSYLEIAASVPRGT